MEEDRDTLVVDGFGGIPLLREKPFPGAVLCRKRIPVLQNELPGLFRKLCISGRAVFGRAYKNPAPGMFDVSTLKMPDFADAQAGGEHQAEKGLEFQVVDGRKEKLHFCPGRDKGKIRIKLPERKLVRIPWFMKDIEGKKAQLGDNTVDCAIGKIPGILEPPDETAQFLPGNLFRGFMENAGKIIQIEPYIGAVACKCMVLETTQGEKL